MKRSDRKILIEKIYGLERSHIEDYLSPLMQVKNIDSVEEDLVEFPCYVVSFREFREYIPFLKSLFENKYLHEIPGIKKQKARITIFTGHRIRSNYSEIFVQCETSKMNDVEFVKIMSTYYMEYTYRKSPEGYILKYSDSGVKKQFPLNERNNVFPIPTDCVQINKSHKVNMVYFVHKLNNKQDLTRKFFLRFASPYIMERTIISRAKDRFFRRNTNCQIFVRTYIFHYSERELLRCLRNHNIEDPAEMFFYHYYCVIKRILGNDEQERLEKNNCQIISTLVVENLEEEEEEGESNNNNYDKWENVLTTVQLVKRFYAEPYLLPEYRNFTTPLVYYLFQEYEDDRIKLMRNRRKYTSMVRPKTERITRSTEREGKDMIHFKRRRQNRRLNQKSFFRIYPGELFTRNKHLLSEVTEEISEVHKNYKIYGTRIIDERQKNDTYWQCKVEIGKLMFWNKMLHRSTDTTEISLEDASKIHCRMNVRPFYRCDLEKNVHLYIRTLYSQNKLKKIIERNSSHHQQNFEVNVIDTSEGKIFILDFQIDLDDETLKFEKYVETTDFTKISVSHSYSFDLDYEITFSRYNDRIHESSKNGIDWIIQLFEGKSIHEIGQLNLVTNDRFIFYYETNFRNIKVERYRHEKSGFCIEIKEEIQKETEDLVPEAEKKKKKKINEEERFIEYSTFVVPPVLKILDGDSYEEVRKKVEKVVKNVSRFTSELLKKGTELVEKRKKKKKKKKKN